MRYIPALLLAFILACPPTGGAIAQSQGQGQRSNGYFGLVDEVADTILTTPEFLAALQDRNAENSLETARADHVAWLEMDQSVTWPIMSNPLSTQLRSMLVYYEGMVTSIVVLDDVGAVLAAWPKPLRYWQGDQPVFRETYETGPKAEFVERVSREWVTGSWEQHVAKTLSLRGRRVGAISVGIDIQRFSKRLRNSGRRQ